MKNKYIKFLILFIFSSSLILTLSGCEETELDRSIAAWKKAYPDRTGDCGISAMQRQAYYKRKGIKVIFCHGYWKGAKHCWVEYQSGDQWLIDDKEIGNKGYPRESYKTGNNYDYILDWWGE